MEQHIKDAIDQGKDISGVLADALQRTSLADHDRPNLQRILKLAEELRHYQSPVEFTIGLIGDSGVGKSSLINCLLGSKNLAKTGGMGHACTAAVTEYRNKRESDTSNFTFEVECMGNLEMEDLLRQSVLDYVRYHLLETTDERPDSSEMDRLKKKADTAWGILSGAFENLEECQESFFQDRDRNTDDLIRTVLDWRGERQWPRGFNENTVVHTADNEEDCTRWRDEFLVSWIWPFIKVIRVYCRASVLENGIVLVDLPGFRDVNTARMRIAEMRLKHCDEIFLVTELDRAITNQGVQNILLRQLGRDFNSLQRRQGVAIICTKAEVDCDDLVRTTEILNVVPHSAAFTREINTLREKIREADEDDIAATSDKHKAELNHLLMSCRNKHVEESFRARYRSQKLQRKISIFCVSNTLYQRGIDLQERTERAQRRNQRLSNIGARTSAAKQKLESSGIPAVYEFISRIPSNSQTEETKHYLNARVLTLIQQIGLWLNARVAGEEAIEPGAPGRINEIQTELRGIFDTSIRVSHDQLTQAKHQMLVRPLTQGTNRWVTAALSAVRKFERWHSATFLAFWNNDGAHFTNSRPYTDWNEIIIRAMVEDIQPSEKEFLDESQKILDTFKRSTHSGLTLIRPKLAQLQRIDDFILTFPRRHQTLEYEIEAITTSYLEQLQTIFHDLLKSHSSSFVMQRMQPMYNEIDSGNGVTKRRTERLKRQISGDPKLFKVITRLFLAALEALLGDVNTKLQQAVNNCSAEIENDLNLVRGEEVPAVQENDLRVLCTVWEEASANREIAAAALEEATRAQVA
ncbi:hypothetical protein HYFRA_00000470 [Hymenoscyphus fraxineus]|uniref:G domain-containing protein n=1 Tax=Hymenoscyphus fraxineus TaxID=746836 RepID=A0A9N9L274_9HELO|nr:hypothetical protein HYFRA_00000470 [Hymenoscyphus fraxineus]